MPSKKDTRVIYHSFVVLVVHSMSYHIVIYYECVYSSFITFFPYGIIYDIMMFLSLFFGRGCTCPKISRTAVSFPPSSPTPWRHPEWSAMLGFQLGWSWQRMDDGYGGLMAASLTLLKTACLRARSKLEFIADFWWGRSAIFHSKSVVTKIRLDYSYLFMG